MKRARITEELAYGNALDRLTGAGKPASEVTELDDVPRMAMIKVSVFLDHDEDRYLENLSSTAKFSGGKKISKTRIVAAMVRAFSTANLDVRGVKTDEELFERVIAQLRS